MQESEHGAWDLWVQALGCRASGFGFEVSFNRKVCKMDLCWTMFVGFVFAISVDLILGSR